MATPTCQECGALLGQQHVWGCDLVLHGDVALVDGQPPPVTFDDCEEFEHVDYPHEPGRLYDCPACEEFCHCTAGHAECVYEGEHNGLAESGD